MPCRVPPPTTSLVVTSQKNPRRALFADNVFIQIPYCQDFFTGLAEGGDSRSWYLPRNWGERYRSVSKTCWGGRVTRKDLKSCVWEGENKIPTRNTDAAFENSCGQDSRKGEYSFAFPVNDSFPPTNKVHSRPLRLHRQSSASVSFYSNSCHCVSTCILLLYVAFSR